MWLGFFFCTNCTKGSPFSLAAMHPYILFILSGIRQSSLNDTKCYSLYLASSQLRLVVALCSTGGLCRTWVLEGQLSLDSISCEGTLCTRSY